MGDPSVEVTDDKRDAAQTEKSKAIDAINEGMLHLWIDISLLIYLLIFCFFSPSGKLDEAIDYLTEAIMINPTSAILYATRGDFVYGINYP